MDEMGDQWWIFRHKLTGATVHVQAVRGAITVKHEDGSEMIGIDGDYLMAGADGRRIISASTVRLEFEPVGPAPSGIVATVPSE